jgi:imidazole glycerol-phosphate synthase subunit HisH
MIIIVDYGLGNLGSVKNMLKKIGFDSKISRNKNEILNASLIILPGVGSFDYGVKNLNKFDLIEPLNTFAIEHKKPVIGICLGMQLMCNSSEEGDLKGLSWFNTKVTKFSFPDNLVKIPHMGWNNVVSNDDILSNSFGEKRFYFVHSYYVKHDSNFCLAASDYGGITFSSAIKKNNLFGFQFHPEKSHKYGMTLLKKLLNQYI